MLKKDTIQKLQNLQTPFYYYDTDRLKSVLQRAKTEAERYNFQVHYALKANANAKLLGIIKDYGFGADCVSGNEVKQAYDVGFPNNKIVFAGVAKTDLEINTALDCNIGCFNCESVQEIEIINQLAAAKKMVADIALRLNPNVNAKTHHYITTGLEENKFGINLWELDYLLKTLPELKNIKLTGLHFHIGSQITDLNPFKSLCIKVNEIQELFYNHKIIVEHINVGGGLGIDYDNPDAENNPDFAAFFKLFDSFLDLRPRQSLHFELGRSLIAHCGSLISRIIFVKKGVKTNFAIIDGGMTELIRPALYQAYHKIENITSTQGMEFYDVVGPICESSDTFGKTVKLTETKRGDLIAIYAAGAYGEAMASTYNMRNLVKAYYSDEI